MRSNKSLEGLDPSICPKYPVAMVINLRSYNILVGGSRRGYDGQRPGRDEEVMMRVN